MYCAIGTVLEIKNKLMNKTDKNPAFWKHAGQGRQTELSV